MNARTIRKRLMSRPNHRTDVFWGRRAYLTLSVPLSMYPEAPPPFTPPGLPDSFEGHWRSFDGGRRWHIGRLSCGVKPADDRAGIVGLRERSHGFGWEWYEGEELRMEGDEVAERNPLPEEMILAYARREQWERKWLYGLEGFEEEELSESLGVLLLCSNWAKSAHANIDGERVLFSYGVKWFYPHHKLRFCRDVTRFLAVARRAGIDARVWR